MSRHSRGRKRPKQDVESSGSQSVEGKLVPNVGSKVKEGSKEKARAAYKILLSTERLRPTSDPERAKANDPNLEAFSDKGRIVRAAPFRRLESKAQVFSMARGGAVRTRLTHSIEVGNYGQLIAETLAALLVKEGSLSADLRFSFVQIVENACLLHDIGNPPFGHMGEYAIQKWFSDEENRKDLLECWLKIKTLTPEEAERHLAAYANFDGNPQGFRIITRLQSLHDEHGLNLTCALLASYLKYLGDRPHPTLRFRKKIGYFPSEEPLVKEVWKRLGLQTDSMGLPLQRHPLAFVMEAADDIAYCLSDIEDALEKSVVTEEEFISWIADKNSPQLKWALDEVEKLKTAAIKKGEEPLVVENDTYHFFRVSLSQFLVKCAVNAYINHEDDILSGSMETSLLGSDAEATRLLDLQKEFCSRKVYTSREAISTEIGGLSAITGLLNSYMSIMRLTTLEFDKLRDEDNKDRLRKYPIESLLFSLLPPKHKQVYAWQRKKVLKLEPVFRTQLIVDYVSGMTDGYALKIFNMINGTQQFGIE